MSDADRVKAILQRPYARTVFPDESVFFGWILEFPGCFATGDTAVEALTNLEGVAADWLMATLAQGQDIPEPAFDDTRNVAAYLAYINGQAAP